MSLSKTLLTPRRKITGISAILLPFLDDQANVDWVGFENHVARTFDNGLAPAINMDTGYAHLIDDATRVKALQLTSTIASGRMFTSGAFVGDQTGAAFDLDSYSKSIEQIQSFGGTPIIFQSYGLNEQSDDAIVASFQKIGQQCDQFIAFELGQMFAPFGKIYSLEVYQQLMEIQSCIGAKHSSLERELEWQRLRLRNERRPDFKVFTGNDLAIDMVMYGSDYLLGLSTFAPDLFRIRDDFWANGDDRFYQLNDVLQYLGAFAFRGPTAAYKHNAAMFLKLQGWIETNFTHPGSVKRPESDIDVLSDILKTANTYR